MKYVLTAVILLVMSCENEPTKVNGNDEELSYSSVSEGLDENESSSSEIDELSSELTSSSSAIIINADVVPDSVVTITDSTVDLLVYINTDSGFYDTERAIIERSEQCQSVLDSLQENPISEVAFDSTTIDKSRNRYELLVEKCDSYVYKITKESYLGGKQTFSEFNGDSLITTLYRSIIPKLEVFEDENTGIVAYYNGVNETYDYGSISFDAEYYSPDPNINYSIDSNIAVANSPTKNTSMKSRYDYCNSIQSDSALNNSEEFTVYFGLDEYGILKNCKYVYNDVVDYPAVVGTSFSNITWGARLTSYPELMTLLSQ